MVKRHQARDLPSRVLIVRLGAIGDVVNALVVASAIKEARPDVFVGWAVHDLARPLVDGHPDVDRVHLWPRGSGFQGFSGFLRDVRSMDYGLVIDLQRIFKSAMVARLTRVGRIVGFDRARSKELSWLWTREKIEPGDPASHMVRQYMEFVEHLGLETAGPVHRFPDDPAAASWADTQVTRIGGAPLVVNLGASKPPNRWAPERFAELSQRLAAEAESPVVLTGGPGDRDIEADVLGHLRGAGGVTSLVGETSLLQLVELLRRSRLFIGCDTGPMHLAAAVRTPVVALFGPADPGRTGPWGYQHRVVRAPGLTGSMDDIGVELVLDAVRDQLLAGV